MTKDPSVSAIEAINKRIAKLERIDIDIEYIKVELAEIKGALKEMRSGYLTQREFDPYKKVIMALVLGLIANSVALIYK